MTTSLAQLAANARAGAEANRIRLQGKRDQLSAEDIRDFEDAIQDLDLCANEYDRRARQEGIITRRAQAEGLPNHDSRVGGAASGPSLSERMQRPIPADAMQRHFVPSLGEIHEISRQQERAWSTGTSGVTLPVTYWNDYIDRLRAATIVLRAGPELVPVNGHSLILPTQTASTTVSNRVDGTAITASDATVSSIILTPDSFAGLSLVSNELLRDWPLAQGILEKDLQRQMAQSLDVAFLTGTGTAPAPLGLFNKAGTQTFTSAGTTGPTLDEIATTIGMLEAVNADRSRFAILTTPALWAAWRQTKDLQGRYILQPELALNAQQAIFGVPVHTSANITTGRAIVADMSQVYVGISQDADLQASADFAFNANQTAFRITARADIAVGNPQALVLVNHA